MDRQIFFQSPPPPKCAPGPLFFFFLPTVPSERSVGLHMDSFSFSFFSFLSSFFPPPTFGCKPVHVYCTVLYYTVEYCIVLYYTILYELLFSFSTPLTAARPWVCSDKALAICYLKILSSPGIEHQPSDFKASHLVSRPQRTQ